MGRRGGDLGESGKESGPAVGEEWMDWLRWSAGYGSLREWPNPAECEAAGPRSRSSWGCVIITLLAAEESRR